MNFGICNLTISPMRADHSDRAEIVSQLLFGDSVSILKSYENWLYVEGARDGYQGWVDFKQITVVSEMGFEREKDNKWVAPLQFDNQLRDEKNNVYHIQAGSSLPGFQNSTCKIGEKVFKLDFEPLNVSDNGATLLQTAQFFLNAPYLWGGKSQFGIDCSGFTQLVFKMHGISLQRDASMQADQGNLVDFLMEANAGDVAFFDNDEGKITHVGILLDNQRIIHASGKVRIDSIDDQGIFNKELNKYTHKLRIIKRMID